MDVEKVHDVETLLRGEGFKLFEVELGGRGVGILEKFDQKMVDEFRDTVGSIAKEDHAWLYWSSLCCFVYIFYSFIQVPHLSLEFPFSFSWPHYSSYV